ADRSPRRRRDRGRGSGPDDADDRHRRLVAYDIERHRRRGIASDDHELAIAVGEPPERLAGERQDLVPRPRAVRHPRFVAEIDGRFAWELAAELPQHREPADAGVNDPDGKV